MSLLDKSRLFQTTILGGLLLAAAPAYAQVTPDVPGTTGPNIDEVIELADDDDDGLLEADEDTIVVTGSRLRRDEFTSASPLKVLNIEESIQAGVVDVASIVQRSSVASGTQFDNTFTGFVTDSGPGAATVNLRGLDAERSLILLNGRRLAPAGVQGAPTRPDLNLIPINMLERTDILTEGASAIYGADAVAGVVNFITRTDFDGLELDVFSLASDAGGGGEFRASAVTGISNDRGSFGIGAEFFSRDRIKRGQRDFTPCIRDIEVNPETGERREICVNGNFSNMFLDPIAPLFGRDIPGDGRGTDFGIIGFDYENGSGFTFIPTNNQAGGPGVFTDPLTGAPVIDAGIGSDWLYDNRYNANETSDQLDLLQGQERYSLFANGSYDLQTLGNAEVFAEVLYGNRSQNIFSGAPQIFPSVSCNNPFIQADPTLSSTVICQEPFNSFLAGINGGLNQLIVLPRVQEAFGAIDVDVTLTRGVVGITGDLESVIPTGRFQAGGENFGFNLGNWRYDGYASYDRNRGLTRQSALNEERLQLSLQTAVRNADGSVSCGLDVPPDLFGFISDGPCVPLDITDPVLYLENRLPDDAAAYLAGAEVTTTTIEQSVFGGSIGGDLAYVPAGTVPFLIGAEFRRDELTSENSFLLTSGAGTGREEVSFDAGTEFLEVFMETEVPILKGAPLAEELTLTGAARWTEEQQFGALWTYRLQGIYRPVDWITTSLSYGTTYRAPNLREQALPGQTSNIGAFVEPCVNAVFTGLDPDIQPLVRENCRLQGADVDSLGVGGAVTVPVTVTGNPNVDAETSESIYFKFVAEQPWFDSFDLSVSLGYFELEIEDSVEEPNAAQIIFACLADEDFPNLSSPFCDLIERNSSSDPGRNFISNVNGQFRNLGVVRTDGLDFDVRYSQDFAIGSDELTLTSQLSGTNVFSDRAAFFPGDPLQGRDGRPNRPNLRGDLFTQLAFNDFALNHTVRYIGKTMDDDIDGLRTLLADDELVRRGDGSIVITNDQRLIGTDFRTGEVLFAAGFRDVEETDEQFLHDLSLGYTSDTWSLLLGVRNVFDKEPPLVDEGEGYFTSANAVLGGGYDVRGRSFFGRIAKRF